MPILKCKSCGVLNPSTNPTCRSCKTALEKPKTDKPAVPFVERRKVSNNNKPFFIAIVFIIIITAILIFNSKRGLTWYSFSPPDNSYSVMFVEKVPEYTEDNARIPGVGDVNINIYTTSCAYENEDMIYQTLETDYEKQEYQKSQTVLRTFSADYMSARRCKETSSHWITHAGLEGIQKVCSVQNGVSLHLIFLIDDIKIYGMGVMCRDAFCDEEGKEYFFNSFAI